MRPPFQPVRRPSTRARPTLCRALSALILLTPAAWAQSTTRVSVDSSGAEGNSFSHVPSISADGRYVAFFSVASNLVSGDTNGTDDVFVHDRQNGATERVSVDSGGAQGNGGSYFPSISADGRYVVFFSDASNLVSGDTNGFRDVFLHDRQGGATERVSIDSGGAQGIGDSHYPSISADGRYVAFESNAFNLVSGDTNGLPDLFVHDRQGGTTERVSVDSGGAQGNGFSFSPSISADGRYVAFFSNSDNLVSGDTNFSYDVFIRDRQSGTTERVSVDSGGAQVNLGGIYPSISADGRYVAFVSGASNLVSGDTNGTEDVFVHDRQSGTTERVSVATGGAQGNSYSIDVSISTNGRYVAFTSDANTLVSGDTNGTTDAFVHDRQDSTTERVSVDSSGAQGNGGSRYPSISADGGFVAFMSFASNLVSGDTNANSDVFLRDRRSSISSFCFGNDLDTSHSTPCPCGNTGALGHGCANSVNTSGARLTTTGETIADDVVLVGSRMPATSTCIYLQGATLEDASFGDGVRCAGVPLIRLRARSNVAGMSSFPDSTDTITLSARGGVTPGSNLRRYYQTYYRNASATFCTPETFNVTNGMIIDW